LSARRCAGAPAGGQRAGDDLEGGEGVVRGERHGCALHRPGVAVAERDRGEFQRPAEGRAALIGDLRHGGRGEAAGGPVEAALQPPADPACAGQADPSGLRGGMPGAASARARSARLRCGTDRHGGGGYHAPTLTRGGPMRATLSSRRFKLLGRIMITRNDH